MTRPAVNELHVRFHEVSVVGEPEAHLIVAVFEQSISK